MTYLDLRDLASEWRDLLEDETEDRDTDRITALEGLCGELGVSPVEPDALERWAEDYESTLVPEDEFEDYARQLAEDIGAIDDDARWPMDCIDWARAADELRADYMAVSFADDDYLIRSS